MQSHITHITSVYGMKLKYPSHIILTSCIGPTPHTHMMNSLNKVATIKSCYYRCYLYVTINLIILQLRYMLLAITLYKFNPGVYTMITGLVWCVHYTTLGWCGVYTTLWWYISWWWAGVVCTLHDPGLVWCVHYTVMIHLLTLGWCGVYTTRPWAGWCGVYTTLLAGIKRHTAVECVQ